MCLPSSGARYDLTIVQPKRRRPSSDANVALGGSDGGASSDGGSRYFPFTTWERDEGNGVCPSCRVRESHTDRIQTVGIDIRVEQDADGILQYVS